jgi:hypothetical protein
MFDVWEVTIFEQLKHATKLDFWRRPVRILTAFSVEEK